MSSQKIENQLNLALEATEREVMVPTVRKFVTAEALERFKAEREG